MDLNEAREFIAKTEQKSRELEVEKAKLEQQKEYTEKALKENEKAMKEYGCTPDTIENEINSLSETISSLRSKLEEKLAGVSEGGN